MKLAISKKPWNTSLLSWEVSKRANKTSSLNQRMLVSYNGLQQLLESMGEGVIGIDKCGHCFYLNKSAADIIGYSKKELIGKKIQTILSVLWNETTAPILANHVNSVPFMDKNQQYTGVFKHKQHGNVVVEYSVYPLQHNSMDSGAVVVFREISRSLHYHATHDFLTGALNRREFVKLAERALITAQKNNSEHVLCYLDVDHFKTINDTYGHAAGDNILCILVANIKSNLRSRDAIGRMGGDEFAMLFEHTSKDQAYAIALNLCKTINEFSFKWDEKTLKVSVSIGIVSFTSTDTSIGDVIHAADKACLQSKKSGRNQVNKD